MGRHIFLSYDRDDAGYVHRLAAALTEQGVPVWFDRETRVGQEWERLIEERIATCAAFVVVMTPRSRASDWVGREIALARLRGRPILPLLLEGEPFFGLLDAHYDDVTGGRLPSEALVTQLRALLGGDPGPPGAPPAPPPAVGTLRVRWSGAAFSVNTPVVVSVDGTELVRHRTSGPLDVAVSCAAGPHTVRVEIDRPLLRRVAEYTAIPVLAGAVTMVELRFSFLKGRFEDKADVSAPQR